MGAFPALARAANPTVAGAATSPFPTLENLSVEWAITGDDNLNGVVTVRFREQGTTDWRQGMPLRRIPAGTNEGFSWNNRHAGSLLDLKPATSYEIEQTPTDPDGGSESRVISAATRPVPQAPAGVTVRSVTPSTFQAALDNAEAGTILLLGAGTYPGFTFNADGTASRPIVKMACLRLDLGFAQPERSEASVEGPSTEGPTTPRSAPWKG